MNRDQVQGTAKDIAGKVQRKVGEAAAIEWQFLDRSLIDD